MIKMRFVKYILIIIIVVPFYSYSQSFKGGILAGVSASEISGDRLEGPNKPGIYAGAFVYHDLTMKSSLQMELNFIQKGSRNNPDTASPEAYLLRLNYIEIPFHYRYNFHPKMSLEVGLSYGVLIHKYEQVDGYAYDRITPRFKNGDFSFNIGFFYSITERLRFNIRYSNSILHVRPHGSGATYMLNKGQYNEVLSFVFFYQLNL